jgi:hypothetical protein
MFSILGFVLPLLEALLKQVKSPSANIAEEVVVDVEAAVAALRRVHGTPVVKAQLDSMRADPDWAGAPTPAPTPEPAPPAVPAPGSDPATDPAP